MTSFMCPCQVKTGANTTEKDIHVVKCEQCRAEEARAREIVQRWIDEQSDKPISELAVKSGVSVSEWSSVWADMAQSGLTAAKAGENLRKKLLEMQEPTEAARAALDGLGVRDD